MEQEPADCAQPTVVWHGSRWGREGFLLDPLVELPLAFARLFVEQVERAKDLDREKRRAPDQHGKRVKNQIIHFQPLQSTSLIAS